VGDFFIFPSLDQPLNFTKSIFSALGTFRGSDPPPQQSPPRGPRTRPASVNLQIFSDTSSLLYLAALQFSRPSSTACARGRPRYLTLGTFLAVTPPPARKPGPPSCARRHGPMVLRIYRVLVGYHISLPAKSAVDRAPDGRAPGHSSPRHLPAGLW
jgi:hypothetical protein